MATITPMTIDDILKDYAEYVVNEGVVINDMNEGAKIQQIVTALATPVAKCWDLLKTAATDSNPATATGLSLKLMVNVFGMYEKTGSPATGSVLAIPKVGGASGQLKQGEVLLYNGGTYVVLEDVTLGSPYSVIQVQAGNNGSKWRLSANTRLLSAKDTLNRSFDFLVGSILTAQGIPSGGMEGGEDEEKDDEIRSRFADYIQSLTRATWKAVYQAALGISGIKSLSLIEYVPMIGMMTLYVDDGSANPVVSDSLKATILAELKKWKAGGIVLKIRAMRKVLQAVELNIQVEDGFTTATVKTAVEAALTTALNSYAYGQTLWTSKLVDIAHNVPGVASTSVVSPVGLKVDINSNEVFRPLSVTANANI